MGFNSGFKGLMVKIIVNIMLIMHTFRLSANLHSGDIEDKPGPDQNKYFPLFSVI